MSEQRRELGVLKAIGGRRGQIRGIYLRTATLFGAIGGVAGAALAALFANTLASYLGRRFFGIHPSWSIPPQLIAGGIALGLAVAIVASLPSLRRVAQATIHEALADDAAAGSGATRVDRGLRLLRFAPMTSVGLRSVNRRRSRSAATVVQVAISVALMLSFLALGRTVVDVTNHNWDLFSADIQVNVSANGKPLSPETSATVAALPNVARVEPVDFANVEVDGEQFRSLGPPGRRELLPIASSPRTLALRRRRPDAGPCHRRRRRTRTRTSPTAGRQRRGHDASRPPTLPDHRHRRRRQQQRTHRLPPARNTASHAR